MQTIILRPTGSGHYDQALAYPAAPSWNKVNEVVKDDDATYAYDAGGTSRTVSFTVETPIGCSGIILAVRAKGYFRRTDSNHGLHWCAFYIPGYGMSASSAVNYTDTNWHVDDKELTINPATGVAFTWSEIATLEILYNLNSGGEGYEERFTQASMEVDCEPLPTVTTQDPTDKKATQLTVNGNITAIDGVNCTRRGFCYKLGITGDPTVADSVVYEDGSFGTGAFTKLITGLTLQTNYRIRAYAINPRGTSYGSTIQAITLPYTRKEPLIIIKNPAGETLAYGMNASVINPEYRVNELGTCKFNLPADSHARPYLVYPNEAWLYIDGKLKNIFKIVTIEKTR